MHISWPEGFQLHLVALAIRGHRRSTEGGNAELLCLSVQQLCAVEGEGMRLLNSEEKYVMQKGCK